MLFASDIPYGDQFYHQYLTLGALRRVGCTDDEVRAVLGGTATRLLEGVLPAKVSSPRSDGQVTLALDRARVNNYLASVTPLLLTGQVDAIGFLGMAAACCGDDEGLADVRELILAAESCVARARRAHPRAASHRDTQAVPRRRAGPGDGAVWMSSTSRSS